LTDQQILPPRCQNRPSNEIWRNRITLGEKERERQKSLKQMEERTTPLLGVALAFRVATDQPAPPGLPSPGMSGKKTKGAQRSSKIRTLTSVVKFSIPLQKM